MTKAAPVFDEYNLKARVFPAMLVGAPLLTLAPFVAAEPIVGSVSSLMFLGVSALCAQLLLYSGRATELRLLKEWGGFPTTLLLLHDGTDSPALRSRRRANVERVAGVSLPSARRERAHPADAREEYAHAVSLCIDRVRTGEQGSRLLQIENIAYGFRRNLRAGRKLGILISLLSLIGTVVLASLFEMPAVGAGLAVVNLAALLTWLFAISDSWVSDQAEKYAQRFFRTLDGVAD
ncbi:hypothetical protein GCM10027067_39060 [Pseudactinotalea suaedae]